MKLPTPAEMAALERHTQEVHGIETSALMEQAGRRTAEVARRLLRASGGRRCVVLAGKGNNGGDGLVAARHLSGDHPIHVLLVASAEELPPDLGGHLHALRDRQVRIEEAQALPASGLERAIRDADLIIDAIFGTGFHGPARGFAVRVIEAANASGVPILAVDVPSGVDAVVGRADPPCIRATATVAMALPKIGTVQYPAAAQVGRLFVADIGIPESVIREAPIPTALATAAWMDRTVPHRPADSHKGRYGRVAILGGARGYAGAPVLAARGAIRAGAGLVTIGLPASLAAIPPASLPEAMTRPLPESAAGALCEAGAEAAREFAGSADVLAVGPGLTTHPETVGLIRGLLPRVTGPVVLDADGLNAFAGEAQRLREVPGPLVITPHPGEMARLLGREVGEVQEDRLATARAAASLVHGVALLKGARTVVAGPDGYAMVIPTGNPGMATGGMGDVLTGAVAALIGAGLAPFEAAVCAAYLHGLAGDLAADSRGEWGLLASEVADHLPRALARVRSGSVDDGIIPVP
ncbi:MAG TPA: NAD(P)H-hydrate dehydratase [bacterium]|nr:NAD(P)H-hydrate dehydratase [bacterium]